jgi:hypothetical protein
VLVRHLAAAVTGLLVAAALGLLAALFGDADEAWLRAVAFGVCTLGPAYGLGWLLFVSGSSGPDPVVHPEESVEQTWWQRSASGSFLDLLVVAGVGATALSVTDLRVDATSALAALIVVGFADVAVRLTVLRRRDA